jgi:hypothetical protein
MASKQIGLYVNTMLTNSPAIASSASSPIYPRPRSPEDAIQKFEVLRLSLRSMASLPVNKVLYNIELGDGFDGIVKEAVDHMIHEFFPNAEFRTELKRPTSLQEWQASSRFASCFFGPNTPVVCCFNHDHIFVDYNAEPLLNVIEKIFGEIADFHAFLGYSHTPECISQAHNCEAYRHRLASTLGMELDFHSFRMHTESLYSYVEVGKIDGIFVTTPQGLERLWLSARSQVAYIPRPDWPGVDFPETNFVKYLCTREFFRHFDGYGHVTTIPRYLGLSFDDFDIGSGVMKSRIPLFQFTREPDASYDDKWVERLAEAYAHLFKDVYLLSMRDYLFWCLTMTTERPALAQAMEKAYQVFRKTYLEADIENDVYSRIEFIVRNRLFGSLNSIATELLADCQSLAICPKRLDAEVRPKEVLNQDMTLVSRIRWFAHKVKRKIRF